jgi:enamine deaminase RidA (YjgF/YER057c/UK114 family)
VSATRDSEADAGLVAPGGYRYADHVGDQLLVAGQVPHDADAHIVGVGDAKAQARQCLRNLFELVANRGFAINDIHHVTVYVVGERQNLRDAWAGVTESFEGTVPPATLLGVTNLGYESQLVEIDATVVRTPNAAG